LHARTSAAHRRALAPAPAATRTHLLPVHRRARPRGGRGPTRALLVLLAGAIALRVWLMLDYGPAFVGFGDSHEYVTAATLGIFHDVQKPAGYPLFLVLAHALSSSLTFTIALQHTLGLATGVLLYAAVRRTGAPAWLGLAPAAVVFFASIGVLLEHSLLADPLFTFLQTLSVYAAVRALGARTLRWALLAGLAAGAAFWVKTVGLSEVPVIAGTLALAGGARLQRRLVLAGVAGTSALALVLGYVLVQGLASGYWGYERQDAWNLYGRVATFVNCTRFTPPAGTRFLCPTQPQSARGSESYYQYASSAPAVRRFGGPAHAPASANATIERFNVAAIEHQPLAYLGAIARSLSFYVTPRSGEGYTPQSLREALVEAKGTHSIQPSLSAYYPHAHGYTGSAGALAPLDYYERHTRIQGALLIAMLIAALAGAPLLSGRPRAACVLFLMTAVCSVVLAAAGNSYDARYGYPAFGPLAAAAALGAWAIAVRFSQARARLRDDRQDSDLPARRRLRAGERP